MFNKKKHSSTTKNWEVTKTVVIGTICDFFPVMKTHKPIFHPKQSSGLAP